MVVSARQALSTCRPCHDPHYQGGIYLPFLYTTSTIIRPIRAFHDNSKRTTIDDAKSTSPAHRLRAQQVRYTPRDASVAPDNGSIARRFKREEFIPFERVESKSAAEKDFTYGTTITRSEKEAFEKLFRLSKPLPNEDHIGNGPSSPPPATRWDEIEITDQIQSKAPGQTTHTGPESTSPSLQTQTPDSKPDSPTQNIRSVSKLAQGRVKDDLDLVQTAFRAAKTDQVLWAALQAHVLVRVVRLDLDKPQTPRQAQAIKHTLSFARRKPRKAPIPKKGEELELLTLTLPRHLLDFMSIMRQNFPASALALNVVPFLKTLGPSAFAMGASTLLYNAHMELHYARYKNLGAVVACLEEMDAEVYSFDANTEKLLDGIAKEAARALGGGDATSPGVTALWRTQQSQAGLESLWQWRQKIKMRRQREAMRRVHEQETLDRVRREDEMISV